MTQRSSSSSGPGMPGSTTSVTDQAKQATSEVAEQVKETTGQVADLARQQVSTRLSGQKERAAEGLTSVADALRQTGQQLRGQDQQMVTDYIDSAAAQVEKISNYLRQNDLGRLVDDIEGLARRQPGLFLGGAFALGLLGARFLKSSRPYTPPTGGYPGSYSGGARANWQPSYSTSYPPQTGGRLVDYGASSGSGAYTNTGSQRSQRAAGSTESGQRPWEE